MTDMPYARDASACDLCGRPAERLTRVELEPARPTVRAGRELFRAARVIHVCDRHPDVLNPPPRRGRRNRT
jgi:hypothetical protein